MQADVIPIAKGTWTARGESAATSLTRESAQPKVWRTPKPRWGAWLCGGGNCGRFRGASSMSAMKRLGRVLAERVMVIHLGRQECAAVRKPGRILGDSEAVVCPMAPVTATLRDDLVRSSPVAASRTRRGDAGPEGARISAGRHA